MSVIKRLFTIRMWTEDTVSDLRLENILKDELKSDLISCKVEFTAEELKEKSSNNTKKSVKEK